jgi:methyltransferase (TIGR00027 family)
MQIGQPSRTALAAAAHRAAHQILEEGRIFRDPLALAILGEAPERVAEEAADPGRRAMRLFIAVRTRFAEEALARAAARGTRQLVVLGAGLDTFAYRNPHEDLAVFEVDHPATQAWKRTRLAEAGVTVPKSLRYVPVDFEHETLTHALAAADFDRERPAFFSWLGVVPYLTEEAIFATFAAIGRLPAGTQVVFDYGDPPDLRDEEARARHEARAARVAALGEPWLSFFEPAYLAARLNELGFGRIEDLGPAAISARFFPHRSTPVRERGGHVVLATVE